MSKAKAFAKYSTPRRFQRPPDGKSPVDQSAFKDTDVNRIAKQAAVTKHWPGAGVQPVYGDITRDDFHEALEIIRETNAVFDRLPAEVRSAFGNDPENMVAFLQDERNDAQARKWGLKPPLATPPSSGSNPPPSGPSAAPNPPSKGVSVEQVEAFQPKTVENG